MSEQGRLETFSSNDNFERNDKQDSLSFSTANISKRQLKKMKKRQEYLKIKSQKRLEERQKKKLKRAKKIANNEVLGPSKKQLKLNSMQNSQCKIRVVIDCSFDDYMSEKDVMKFSQQLQYCYARNRRAANPLQFYITSLEKKTLSRLNQIGSYKSWDINIGHKCYLETFQKEEIVYLTSDSPNVLSELSPEKVYIIGGLVDHNHHKSLCYNLAVERNISHAQLPIGNFLQLASRNVLAVNHVFEILLKFTERNDWKEAFYSVIPKRKIAFTNNEETSKKIDELTSEEHLKNNELI
ncbi:hypothetical protein HELRODRAFT_62052 [Helobdella robusta]|uniref:tRNA (guanine(9)-N(1))-methyltransferase n=1 Tax=Helobdella robusta TaxID=6412 RepID=T1FWU8_HELRO|nr:hypothetical protein HELRODRAFT_62052 [Helobdella robusta]ESO12470.1 hypothetical protein HELRODRAFT_62052 [Helobdella robusta]